MEALNSQARFVLHTALELQTSNHTLDSKSLQVVKNYPHSSSLYFERDKIEESINGDDEIFASQELMTKS